MIVMSNDIALVNLSKEEIKSIKKALTFNNPAHANAKRFSGWKSTSIPQYLYLYEDERIEGNRILRVPRGFDFSSHLQRTANFICDKSVSRVRYPKFLFELRDDQKEAAKSFINSNISCSKLKGIVVLPTGKGKTILALYLAYRLKCKTLVMVHKTDLLLGWEKDIKDAFGGKLVPGRIQGKKRNIGAQITLATFQTMSRMDKSDRDNFLDRFDFVIGDEAHHLGAPMFDSIQKFNARYKLGLTATLERKDGLLFIVKLTLGDIAYAYVMKEDEKDILQVEVKRVDVTFKHDPIFSVSIVPAIMRNNVIVKDETLSCKLVTKKDRKLREGESRYSELLSEKKTIDYAWTDLDSDAVMHEETIAQVLSDVIREYNSGSNCLVFFSQKEHCRTYEEFLRDAGIPKNSIGLYYGDNKNNAEVLKQADKGVIRITLTTYSKTSEGTNCKAWDTAFLVSSIAGGTRLAQAVGRIRRTCKGKRNIAKLYDYNYCNVAGLKNQSSKRDARYRQLRLKTSERKGTFSRGYKKR